MIRDYIFSYIAFLETALFACAVITMFNKCKCLKIRSKKCNDIIKFERILPPEILHKNDTFFEAGDSFSKAHHFWYPFWKFVVPTVSYFAWLPECLAHAFCAESLATSKASHCADPALCYTDLEEFEGPFGKRGFGVPAALHGLTPLGDTRNSQELSVFCQMPKERLRVSCGLVQEQEAVSHHPDARGQLVRASQHLLRFLIAEEGPNTTLCMPRHCCMFFNHWWSSPTGTSLPLLWGLPLL